MGVLRGSRVGFSISTFNEGVPLLYEAGNENPAPSLSVTPRGESFEYMYMPFVHYVICSVRVQPTHSWLSGLGALVSHTCLGINLWVFKYKVALLTSANRQLSYIYKYIYIGASSPKCQ